MSYKSDETRAFNLSLKRVEETNKKILRAYQDSLQSIKAQIYTYRAEREAAFGLKNAKSIQAANELRLNILYQQVDKEITKLSNQTASIIQSGYMKSYETEYYYHSYNVEKEANRALVAGKITAPSLQGVQGISLNFPLLNTDAVKASFNEDVAGMTFRNRIVSDRKDLQARVRRMVAKTVIEGQTVKELQNSIQALHSTLIGNSGNAQSTARTELLKAFSLAQEESTNESINAGVRMEYKWSSTLDGNTRPAHGRADGKMAKMLDGIPVFNVGGVLLSSPRVVHPANSVNSAGQVINCRCRRLDIPFGIHPTRRIDNTQKINKKWEEIPANVDYTTWKKSLKA